MWSRSSGTPGVRPAAVAGTWYPGDPHSLRRMLERMLAAARPPAPHRRLCALVVPHAGLVYSGRTAAQGFARLEPGDCARVVVMAPSHRVPLRAAAVDPSTHYETPLGRMAVDVDVVHALGERPEFECDAQPFVHEHAIEMQIPFLQLRSPDARLVPVLVGDLRGDLLAATAAGLAPLLDAGTLLVVSSDFTHYGPHYGYVPFQENVPERIQALDQQAIDALARHDAARFHDLVARTGATICGRRALGVLLEATPPRCRGELCAYTTSGEITGDYTNTVSYACIAFHAEDGEVRRDAAADADTESRRDAGSCGKGEPGTEVEPSAEARAAAATAPAPATGSTPPLEVGERRVLLLAARQAIEALFATPDVDRRLAGVEITPRLREPAGVFVSLHRRRDGRLRGCIGSLLPRRGLLDAVIDNARAAAQRDPRFPPLHADELPDLEIELSVLGPLRPVADASEIVVGRDGLVVTHGLQRGVLLPQVAVGQGWDREQFLDNVCRKAGLPVEAWREGATIDRFEASVFSERDPAASRRSDA